MRRGVYPGSFDPPTTAHLAVAEAAVSQRRLDRLDVVVSRRPLGKPPPAAGTLDDRLAVLRESVAHLGVVRVRVSEARLLSEIAEGYDLVVMGADKWEQIHDVAFYGGSASARDAALASLPEIAVAPRPPHSLPPDHALEIDSAHRHTSSTRARSGERSLMTPEARAHAESSGAWTPVDPIADVRRNRRRER